MQLNQRWVLVTGASSGLGYEMAKQLATQHGANLILVARRLEKLESLKLEIEACSESQCKIITADLSKEQDCQRVFEQSTAECEVYAVILNAGVTYFGKDEDLEWGAFKSMLDTNVSSVVHLSRAFVNYFLKQGSDGGILYVLSMAGIVPVPYQSAYSGTKAFLNHYVQGVSQELRDKPFSLSIFAPGGIATEMNALSGLDQYFSGGLFLQSVDSCAAEGIATLRGRKYLFVPRVFNRLQIFLTRLVSRQMSVLTAAKSYEKAMNK